MAKITIKKSGWLIYAIFITLMVSIVYYIQNFRYSGEVTTFLPAVIIWPLATALAIFFYLNYHVRRDRLIDYAAVLSVIFIFSTLLTFSGSLVSTASNVINNILWFSLMMVFYHYAYSYGIEKKYIFVATVTILILLPIFIDLVNQNIVEDTIKTLNPVYYLLYLIPFALMNKTKLWRYLGITFIFSAILMSNKRTALLAFVMVLIFIMIRNHLEAEKSISNLLRNLMLLAVLVIVIYFVANAVLASYSMIDWRERLLTIGSTGGAGRTVRWEHFFRDVGQSNLLELLFGHGFVYPYYHNDLFQVYYNCGIPGLVAYVGLCALLIREYAVMAKRRYKYATAFGASLIIFFFNSIVGQVIVVHTWMLEMGAFWGLVIGDFRRIQMQPTERVGSKYDQDADLSL